MAMKNNGRGEKRAVQKHFVTMDRFHGWLRLSKRRCCPLKSKRRLISFLKLSFAYFLVILPIFLSRKKDFWAKEDLLDSFCLSLESKKRSTSTEMPVKGIFGLIVRFGSIDKGKSLN